MWSWSYVCKPQPPIASAGEADCLAIVHRQGFGLYTVQTILSSLGLVQDRKCVKPQRVAAYLSAYFAKNYTTRSKRAVIPAPDVR